MASKITPQDVYLKRVQTDYKAYCYHVHNHGRSGELSWIPSKFHTFICDTVQEFVERKSGNAFEILILTTPPQHGKSTTVTETYPSFHLGRHPEDKIIEISYNDDLATRFGKRNLEKITEFGKIFGVGINKKKSSSRSFELNNKIGSMISRGIGGSITSYSGNLIIIDDPIKNRKEADSETYRNMVWDEWENTIKTRLSAGGKVIVILTRWHEDDLAGRLIANYGEFCTLINIPCEAEEDDVLGRELGAALCPEIGKDDAWLIQFKESYMTESGARAWNALFQGHPTSREGNILKREWWQYYDYADYVEGRIKFDNLIMSVDATFKDQDKNDFVAIEVWGKEAANMYLVDLVEEHLNFPDTIRAIRGLKAYYPMIGAILIEDKANGSAIIQVLRSEISGIIAVMPTGGKEARVNAVSHAIESGNVYLPRDRAFTGEFIDECAAFPNGTHDDAVDSMSQALARLIYSNKRGQVASEYAGERGWKTPKTKRIGVGKGEQINVI